MRSEDRCERRSGRLRSKRELRLLTAVAMSMLHSGLARAEEIVQPDPVAGQVVFNAVDTNGQQQKISVPLTSSFGRFDMGLDTPGGNVDLVYTPELSATSTGDAVVKLAMLARAYGGSTTIPRVDAERRPLRS